MYYCLLIFQIQSGEVKEERSSNQSPGLLFNTDFIWPFTVLYCIASVAPALSTFCSDKGLMLKMPALKLLTGANLQYQLSLSYQITQLYSPTDTVPQFLYKPTPFIHLTI